MEHQRTGYSLTEGDNDLLGELFHSLETAHEHLAMACSRLSWRLKPHQLLVVLRASVHPMIQLNAVSGFLEPSTSSEKMDLPDDQHKRVKILLTLDPAARLLKEERINSPTCFLAATVAFKIINRFSGSTTQRKLQEVYSVCAKQLAACITRRKY